MFESLIQENVDRVKPYAEQVGQRCNAFAFQVLSRLDTLIEQTKNEEFEEGRERVRRTLTVAGGRLALDPIPMNQEWQLEIASLSAAGTLTIDDGTGFLMGVTTGQFYQPGIWLPRGSQIGLTASADMAVYLQFKVRAPSKGKPAVTGFKNPDAEGVGPYIDVKRGLGADGPHTALDPLGDAAISAR